MPGQNTHCQDNTLNARTKHLMPGQNKTYCPDESGYYGKTIWQYRWPIQMVSLVISTYPSKCRLALQKTLRLLVLVYAFRCHLELHMLHLTLVVNISIVWVHFYQPQSWTWELLLESSISTKPSFVCCCKIKLSSSGNFPVYSSGQWLFWSYFLWLCNSINISIQHLQDGRKKPGKFVALVEVNKAKLLPTLESY